MAPGMAGAVCTNATLKGVYGFTSTGLNGSGVPASNVTQVTADGNGNLTGNTTKSINGTIVAFATTGTYQLSANCTGSATLTNQDGQTEHDNLVLNNGNKGGFLIQTDAITSNPPLRLRRDWPLAQTWASNTPTPSRRPAFISELVRSRLWVSWP